MVNFAEILFGGARKSASVRMLALRSLLAAGRLCSVRKTPANSVRLYTVRACVPSSAPTQSLKLVSPPRNLSGSARPELDTSVLALYPVIARSDIWHFATMIPHRKMYKNTRNISSTDAPHRAHHDAATDRLTVRILAGWVGSQQITAYRHSSKQLARDTHSRDHYREVERPKVEQDIDCWQLLPVPTPPPSPKIIPSGANLSLGSPTISPPWPYWQLKLENGPYLPQVPGMHGAKHWQYGLGHDLWARSPSSRHSVH
ncbi:hypothetical protein PSV09DRAFT_2263460 [Bipolaris maydis]|nr:hypothetical protein PSV09DRAFT_2263460 [Bipolaris maydis]